MLPALEMPIMMKQFLLQLAFNQQHVSNFSVGSVI